jgi:hypothetical protein
MSAAVILVFFMFIILLGVGIPMGLYFGNVMCKDDGSGWGNKCEVKTTSAPTTTPVTNPPTTSAPTTSAPTTTPVTNPPTTSSPTTSAPTTTPVQMNLDGKVYDIRSRTGQSLVAINGNHYLRFHKNVVSAIPLFKFHRVSGDKYVISMNNRDSFLLPQSTLLIRKNTSLGSAKASSQFHWNVRVNSNGKGYISQGSKRILPRYVTSNDSAAEVKASDNINTLLTLVPR